MILVVYEVHGMPRDAVHFFTRFTYDISREYFDLVGVCFKNVSSLWFDLDV